MFINKVLLEHGHAHAAQRARDDPLATAAEAVWPHQLPLYLSAPSRKTSLTTLKDATVLQTWRPTVPSPSSLSHCAPGHSLRPRTACGLRDRGQAAAGPRHARSVFRQQASICSVLEPKPENWADRWEKLKSFAYAALRPRA